MKLKMSWQKNKEMAVYQIVNTARTKNSFFTIMAYSDLV